MSKNTLGLNPSITTESINTNDIRTWNFQVKNMRATTVSQTTAKTYTASELQGGYVVRTVGAAAGNVNDVLPPASSFAALGLQTGDSFQFQIDSDNSGSSFSYAVLAGTGGTYRTNSVTLAATGTKVSGRYLIVITGAASYDVWRLSNLTLVP